MSNQKLSDTTPQTLCEMIEIINNTDDMADMLENSTAIVEIKALEEQPDLRQFEDPHVGLYINGVLVFSSGSTYSSCCEMLLTYMNSY